MNYALQALFTDVQTGVVENNAEFMEVCSIISEWWIQILSWNSREGIF